MFWHRSFMAKKKAHRVFRRERVLPAEADRLNEVRRAAIADFPPNPSRMRPAKTGLAAQIRAAREAQSLT
jgi:hypothetical protein